MTTLGFASLRAGPAGPLAILCVLLVLGLAGVGEAKVFHSRSEALGLAFPEADAVEDETFVLDDAQAREVERRARDSLDSKLVTVYTGRREGRVVGYAVIDVHNVRTLPEAFMVVLTPEGSVRSLRVLAFHEPLDYLPRERWYEQFGDKSLAEPLRLGGDIHGVVGATLSAQATTRGVRRALALYEVLLRDGR